MPTFEPPIDTVGPASFDEGTPEYRRNKLGNRLARFFPGAPAATKSVYRLLDDEITDEEPTGVEGWANVARAYYGGHVHDVTEAEAELLRDAGYTMNED